VFLLYTVEVIIIIIIIMIIIIIIIIIIMSFAACADVCFPPAQNALIRTRKTTNFH